MECMCPIFSYLSSCKNRNKFYNHEHGIDTVKGSVSSQSSSFLPLLDLELCECSQFSKQAKQELLAYSSKILFSASTFPPNWTNSYEDPY